MVRVKSSENGFTLIEVLIAISILSISLIIMLVSLSKVYKYETESLVRLKAQQLAFACSEYIQGLGYNSINNNSCNSLLNNFTFRKTNVNFSFNIVNRQEIYPGKLKIVDVNVYWTIYGKKRKIQITVLKGNNV